MWTRRQSREEKRRCKFLARKSAKLFANTKVQILARKSAKLIANYSATMVTSLNSLSLSLSLSLYLSLSLTHSPSAPHAQYRKRGSASHIVREVRSVRKRDTEIKRDGSDVNLVSLKLAKKFALFLAKNLHLIFSPLKWRLVHTFLCQNVALFKTVRILNLRDRFTSVKWRDRGSKHKKKKRSSFRLHRPSSHRKNESN